MVEHANALLEQPQKDVTLDDALYGEWLVCTHIKYSCHCLLLAPSICRTTYAVSSGSLVAVGGIRLGFMVTPCTLSMPCL